MTMNFTLHAYDGRVHQVPSNKRIAFDASYISIDPDGSAVKLTSRSESSNLPEGRGGTLRFVIGLDVRENRILEVRIADGGALLGTMDIRFAYVLQPFDIVVDAPQAAAILKKGIEVRMVEGESPTFFFCDQRDPFFTISLILSDQTQSVQKALHDRLCSMASIQPFGWMEGCVLDGLLTLSNRGDLRAQATIEEHLAAYVVDDVLRYEDPRSNICDQSVYGIEAGLPFAIMAQQEGYAKPVSLFKEFVEQQFSQEVIVDEDFLSAEGCYTIAYPLAVIGRLDRRDDYLDRAIDELLVRKKHLRDGKDLWLRSVDGELTYKNWGRGFAWYLLGYVQVMRELERAGRIVDKRIIDEFVEIVDFVIGHYDGDLFPVFIDQKETGVETSASAGIAAALAIGREIGVLQEHVDPIIESLKQRLYDHVTEDGMLGGVSQSNRDGERLQRSGYRVISQMAMGLMAHLL